MNKKKSLGVLNSSIFRKFVGEDHSFFNFFKGPLKKSLGNFRLKEFLQIK